MDAESDQANPFDFSPASDYDVDTLAAAPISGGGEQVSEVTGSVEIRRCFTVRGSGIALAMLRGLKRIETRRVGWWPLGWYNLHVGLKPPSLECCEVLAREWSHCPAEDDSLLRSCIVGQVRLDKCYQVDGSATPDPWYIATAGNFCYTIGAAREFQTPVSNIKGRLGIWYVRDDAVRQCLLESASVAMLRMFHSSDAAFCETSSRDSPQCHHRIAEQQPRPWLRGVRRRIAEGVITEAEVPSVLTTGSAVSVMMDSSVPAGASDPTRRRGNFERDMDLELFTERVILASPKCVGPQSTSSVRAWTRNRLAARNVDVRNELLAAAQRLVNFGIVVHLNEADDDESAQTGLPHGRQVIRFEKRTWLDIQRDNAARERVVALQLTADNFP